MFSVTFPSNPSSVGIVYTVFFLFQPVASGPPTWWLQPCSCAHPDAWLCLRLPHGP